MVGDSGDFNGVTAPSMYIRILHPCTAYQNLYPLQEDEQPGDSPTCPCTSTDVEAGTSKHWAATHTRAHPA